MYGINYVIERNFDIVGNIVELRSYDPEGDKNHVRLIADFSGDRIYFTATINDVYYKRALNAHQLKRNIRLSGNGIKLKTQVRVTKIDIFE